MGHYKGEPLSVSISQDAKPIRKSPYSIHPRYEQPLRKELEMMQKEGIIRESNSAWSAPAIVIPKPNRPGDIRLVVDFREVNKLIQKDSHPLPRMDRCLDQVGRNRPRFMTSFDLEKGFFQMELDENSKQYTAFSVPHNLYEFNRLPMGLSTSPAQFQRCMNQTFRDYINQFLVIYLDDILLYSRTFSEHLDALRCVLTRLREAGLKLRAANTQLARKELKFLGFRVTSEGIKADSRICEDVKNFPQPKTVKQPRGFLGLAQFYKRFIKDYAKIAKPLNNLLKKGERFAWSEECDESFLSIKDALTSPPILAHPDLEKCFRLYTDASDYAVGYVLSQDDDAGREKVVAYGGKSLQKYQLSYGVTEKEMLAAYSGVIHFDHYLRHNQFELITDHSALESLLTKQKELKGKFARWAAELLNYTFTVKHRPGKQLGNADAMSRREYEQTVDCDPCIPVKEPTVSAITRAQTKKINVRQSDARDTSKNVTVNRATEPDESVLAQVRESAVDSEYSAADIREQQLKDSDITAILNYLETKELPPDDEEARNIIMHAPDYFLNEDKILHHIGIANGSNKKCCVRYNQLVAPKSIRQRILREYHDGIQGGHFGVDKTLQGILTRYYWQTVTRDVADHVHTCQECQSHKRDPNQRRPYLGTTPEPEVLELVTLDILGPIKETSNGMKHVLVMMDYATRYCVLRPIKDTTAGSVATVFFDEWLSKLGAPHKLSSDRGPAFISQVMREICRIFGIDQQFSCPYVARSHGIVERLQETVQQVLSFYLDRFEDEWDKAIQAVAGCINSTSSVSTGFSPNFLMLGREPRKSIDTVLRPPPRSKRTVREYLESFIANLEKAREAGLQRSKESRERYRRAFNKRARPANFQAGDLVYVYVPRNRRGFSRALSHNWHGPYVIVKEEGQLHYRLRDYLSNNLMSIPIHAQRLKHGQVRDDNICENDRPRIFSQREQPIKQLQESDLPDSSFVQQPVNVIGEATIAPDEAVITDIADLWNEPEVYEVEKIIKGRFKSNGDEEYLVKWRGYPPIHNSYVNKKDLNDACRDYIQSTPVQMTGRPRRGD